MRGDRRRGGHGDVLRGMRGDRRRGGHGDVLRGMRRDRRRGGHGDAPRRARRSGRPEDGGRRSADPPNRGVTRATTRGSQT
jgi:hypothetical protein